MENASKALIIAAEVLIGLMIISVGVYLFNMFGEYSRSTNKAIEDTQISQFNNQFLKYEGKDCTIHDIASIINLAKKNNQEYALEAEDGKSDNTLYIQIDLNNEGTTTAKLEKKDDEYLISLIKTNDIIYTTDPATALTTSEIKYYKCTCSTNPNTKRVNYVFFEEK